MSDWYARQFGDSGRFAIAIAFGAPGHGKGHFAWGGLALWVKDRCLTRAVDAEGVVTDSIRWELLEFLLWLQQSATRLVNEEPLPALATADAQDDIKPRDACDWFDLTEDPPTTLSESEEDEWFLARSEWREHHALRRAIEGVALPNVYFRRLGDMVEVSWDNETRASPRAGLRFVEQRGTEIVPASALSKAIQQSLYEVVSALKERHPDCGALLASLAKPNSCEAEPGDWKWLIHSSTAEAIQGRLGQIAKRLERHVLERHDGAYIPHCEETLVLRHARLTAPADIETLLNAAHATPKRRMSNALLSLIKRSVPSATKPWEEGYRRALEVREMLGWGNEPMPSPETWLVEQHVAVHRQTLPSDVALLSLVTSDDRATITINPASNSRRRREVAYGAALAHILLDEDRVAVDGLWEHWPSAARARAFAIMLQLPDDGVRNILPNRRVRDASDVRLVMQHFKSGPVATTRHLRNRRFISSDELRDDIVRELLVSGER